MAKIDEKLDVETGTAAARRASVRLTHPDKTLFEEPELSKGALAGYYDRVAPRLLAAAADRPLSLMRCPDGQSRDCFYQKHDQGGFDEALGRVPITEKNGARETYFYLADAAGLIAAVQMGVLEFHIWGARRDHIERPDRLVFDLDPDENIAFGRVKAAAIEVRDRLTECDLVSYAMVTGGKGIHVVAPVVRRRNWADIKAFTRGLAHRMAEAAPERYTISTSKKDRAGRILIDYLRNDFGQTAIAPYSTRARSGAPVAMPVSWEELEQLSAPNGFTPEDALARLGDPDPWKGYGATNRSVTAAMLKAVGAD